MVARETSTVSALAINNTNTRDDLPDGWIAYDYVRYGYRVNYSYRMAIASILSTKHNEFWIMWSDVFPMVFLLAMYEFATPQGNDYRTMARSVMFAGAIICRACSLIYHTFHCVSPRLNRDLVYLDLIGICSNALGVPWTVVGIAGWDEGHPYTRAFLGIFMACYAVCVGVFAYHLLGNGRRFSIIKEKGNEKNEAQGMVVSLAVLGCMPCVTAGFWSGPLWFLAGYIVFYVGKFPESWISTKCEERFGGEIWNSHVLWHLTTWAGQMCFICTSL